MTQSRTAPSRRSAALAPIAVTCVARDLAPVDAFAAYRQLVAARGAADVFLLESLAGPLRDTAQAIVGFGHLLSLEASGCHVRLSGRPFLVDRMARGLRAAGVDTTVVRNDAVTVAGIAAAAPDFVVLGPGPGHPADAGYVDLIQAFRGRIPLLGVCLGHQAMGLAYGGTVAKAPQPRHGKTSVVRHDGRGVFTGLPAAYSATRYPSLIVSHEGFPPELEITAAPRERGRCWTCALDNRTVRGPVVPSPLPWHGRGTG